MPRKIVVGTEGGRFPVLVEALADDEAQLQDLVRSNPDLLPVEEFDLVGPLLVVGRETTLPCGAVDLVALTRGGEILIVEFKTGPQNVDFRHTIAQLLDYGSHLWELSLHDFESQVAVPFFTGSQCSNPELKGKTSLEAAARTVWPDISDGEWGAVQSKLEQELTTGVFHYVLVAQRFTPVMERTITYMNQALSAARVYAVELVKFSGNGMAAFESRTVLKPAAKQTKAAALTNEAAFLEQIGDEGYRELVEEFFDHCRFAGLRFEWGSLGVSLRAPSPFRREPLTVGWVFPPGRAGWMGLKDVTLGLDPGSAEQLKGAEATLEWYLRAVSEIESAEPVKTGNLKAYHFPPAAFASRKSRLEEILTDLVHRLNEEPEMGPHDG
jgi:hypothetical protein